MPRWRNAARLPVSLGGAFVVWFACAAASRLVDWSAAGAVLLNAIVFPLAILAGDALPRRGRGEARRRSPAPISPGAPAW